MAVLSTKPILLHSTTLKSPLKRNLESLFSGVLDKILIFKKFNLFSFIFIYFHLFVIRGLQTEINILYY